MESYKYRCPFCDTDITSHHFYEHLERKHEAEIYSSPFTNYQRLLKSQDKPLKIEIEKKVAPTSYYVCLGCSRCCKKLASTERHFKNPTCKENHCKKVKELLDKYKKKRDVEENLPSFESSQPVIIQGFSEEQVLALLGSMMESIKASQREESDFRRKYEYIEEKVKDLCSEEIQEDIEGSLPEYPDDDEIEFSSFEDITPLINLAEKMNLRITNKGIQDAYEKWSKMPLKKKSLGR